MMLLLAVFAVTILVAAGVALWRHGPWTWAEVGRGLCLVGLLTSTVIVTDAALRIPEGTPAAFTWTACASMAAGMAFLWVRWFRADWSRS